MGKALASVTDYLFTDRDIASTFAGSGVAQRSVELFSSDYAAMKRTRNIAASQIDEVQEKVDALGVRVDALGVRVDAVEGDIVRIDGELVVVRDEIQKVKRLAIIGLF